jgi:hypothetical protein
MCPQLARLTGYTQAQPGRESSARQEDLSHQGLREARRPGYMPTGRRDGSSDVFE